MTIIERPKWDSSKNEPSREQLAEAINALRRELGRPETDFIGNRSSFGRLLSAYATERADYDMAIRYGTRMAEWWVIESAVQNELDLLEIETRVDNLNERVKTMAKENKRQRSDKKKDQTVPEPKTDDIPDPEDTTPEPAAAMTDRRAVEILFAVTQDPKDIPEDMTDWDDEGCANELKENVGLLEPNDANVIKERFPEEADLALARFTELGFKVPEPKAEEPKKGKSGKVTGKGKTEGKAKPAGEKKKGGPGPKAGGPDGPGVIGSIHEFLTGAGKKGISEDQILAKLSERFPDRDPVAMKKTIRAQLPGRMAKEKGLKIETKTEKDVKLFFIAA